MKLAVPKESYAGECRVALIPAGVSTLQKIGWQVAIESGAGAASGFPDQAYREKGAEVLARRDDCFAADAVVEVRCLGANPRGRDDLDKFRPGQLLIGTCDPLGHPDEVLRFAETGGALLALELIPRITRAQSMDVLSSMATVAGYRAVLLAASALPKMFPLMMTAAGTLSPARVFVIGAGVAGLQAIATARRLGAVVHAYDVRPAVREQVESLGAKFIELELKTDQAEDQGGYAKSLGEDFYQQQRNLMARVVAESDVVISTAAIPGQQAPVLITAEAVAGMRPGSVIVDLAAERGGNCELTETDGKTVQHGVTILGPTNLPSEIPHHASQMFSKNVATLLTHLTRDGQLVVDTQDEITAGTLATYQGQVVHPRLREMLDLPPAPGVAEATPGEPESDAQAHGSDPS
jgi:NAD(P) transhydrogenase subunit alpha